MCRTEEEHNPLTCVHLRIRYGCKGSCEEYRKGLGCSSEAEHMLSKLDARVQSPAPMNKQTNKIKRNNSRCSGGSQFCPETHLSLNLIIHPSPADKRPHCCLKADGPGLVTTPTLSGSPSPLASRVPAGTRESGVGRWLVGAWLWGDLSGILMN